IELLEVLLADGAMVSVAIEEVATDEIEHPGLKQLLEGLYRLHAEGVQPGLDHLRGRLNNEKLLDKAREFQERGLRHKDRSEYLQAILAWFEERRSQRRRQDLKSQVQAAGDHDAAVELLRQLQDQS